MNQEIKKQIALIVLDGWGYREDSENNAIAEAKTPFFDSFWSTYPHALLNACGEDVGLPEGQIGNSEIGHMTIGSGRVIDTDLVRITKAMQSGDFTKNESFVKLFNHVKKYNSTLHVMGLLSPGGIHSHSSHAYGILRAAKEAGIKKIAIHVFTDGRDVAPQSASKYLKELEDLLSEIGVGKIATVSGRFYAMDRDNNWDRVNKVKKAIFQGEGLEHKNVSASIVVKKMYENGALDEHFPPMIFLDEEGKKYIIEQNDGIFFFNYRPDRARMLSHSIIEMEKEKNLYFVTLTEYSKEMKDYAAFHQESINTTIAGEVSKAGMTQVHIAETEKYPHATYFLNGGREEPHKGEEHVFVESRKDVQTHDLAPEMKAKEIADKAIYFINKGTDFIFINFANADMVGHTANKHATIKAVEVVDQELGRVIAALSTNGGIALITADHGNAEINIDKETGERHTAHTLSRVPVILTSKKVSKIHDGNLSDIAPTILSLYEIPVPKEMTGKSLIG